MIVFYAKVRFSRGLDDAHLSASVRTPASHGCIRLSNSDAVTAYDRFPVGTQVLITPE